MVSLKYLNLIRTFINYIDYFQQKKILKFLSNRFLKDIVIFDIGAHYGETVKLFSNKFKIKEFHCFEPSPINFKVLTKNINSLNIKKKTFFT